MQIDQLCNQNIEKKNIFDIHSIESIKREIDILRSLDHPNIVKYFETYEDEHFGILHLTQ